MGRIAIDNPDSRFDFDMRDRLVTRLGEAHSPEYRLSVNSAINEEGRAVRSDAAITRVNLDGETVFSLYRLNEDKPVFSGRVRAFTAYSTTASAFATQTAAEDAARRLARNLADQIVLRLAASADEWL
ncbi:LPS assembly lipoprotein LptE [Halovulum sp. GXIMD14793]